MGMGVTRLSLTLLGAAVLLSAQSGEQGAAPAPVTATVVADAPGRLAIVLRTQIQQKGFWLDARTGLQWPAGDNGSGVTRSQARAFCRALSTGGFRDWRLPEIGELQTLFGGQPDERGVRVRAPLKITGWAWSNTEGKEPEENWALDFADGARASVVAGDAGPNRALCVRSARN